MEGLESSALGSIMTVKLMMPTYVEGSGVIRGVGSNMQKYHPRPHSEKRPGYKISDPLVVEGIIVPGVCLVAKAQEF